MHIALEIKAASTEATFAVLSQSLDQGPVTTGSRQALHGSVAGFLAGTMGAAPETARRLPTATEPGTWRKWVRQSPG